MEKTLHIKSHKKSKLFELLSKTSDKRRNHTLYLCSCYFSIEAARGLINELNRMFKLTKVVIYIDRKTAISIGRNPLIYFYRSFRNIEVCLHAVESTYLFHSKSYALISFDENDSIFCGSLVVGSANLTGVGLTTRSGNIECLIDSQDLELLEEHVEQVKKLNVKNIEDIELFSKKEEYSFKYALIQQGAFLHKWVDNLEQLLSIRYRLSEKGKLKIGDSSFEQAGFKIETATISKKYFKFDYEPRHLENAENLTRNFGIETYLGYWLPYLAIESLFDKDELDSFKELLFSEIQNQITYITDDISRDLNYLTQEELIEINETSPVELFHKKVSDLKENDLKLKRIFSKYEIFELPYDIQQKDEIEALFEEMIDVSESRKKKNKTMKAFLESFSIFSIEKFRERLSEYL